MEITIGYYTYMISIHNYSLLGSIFSHTKYLNKNSIKNILISSGKKKKKQWKSKQFNLYEKLTKSKSNFDSNQIFSKFWLNIYILHKLNAWNCVKTQELV